MEAATKSKPRDFNSYADEYFLLNSEMEINAFWKRMDNVVATMTEAEKALFFKQLFASIEKDMDEIREIKAQVVAASK